MNRLFNMFELRQKAAAFYRDLGQEPQNPNGDETDFPDLRGTFTKGFAHDPKTGLIANPADFADFFANIDTLAATSNNHSSFVNPQAGLAFDTEGPDSQQLAMPAAPKFNSNAEVAEIAENYWMALLRDVPFESYPGNSLAEQAASHLRTFPRFHNVTARTLFRGPLEGEDVGPYLSQFLTYDVPYGAQTLSAGIAFSLPPDQDYLTSWDAWLSAQNGDAIQAPAIEKVEPPRPVTKGRDIAQYVHIDELFQGYLNACLILITPRARGGFGALTDIGNPYSGADTSVNPPAARHMNQAGFGTLGEPNFKTMVAEVATRALKQVWNQKWFVHRRLRPEAFGGRLEAQRRGDLSGFISQDHIAKLQPALDAVFNKYGTWLLPQAFPEGCPMHPAYGAGHATVAGACVTVLKALFFGAATLGQLGVTPMTRDAAGNQVEYTGADRKFMTVHGELNKLASNIGLGRNIAGVHWRTDYTRSIILGERVALYYLQEYVRTYHENVSFHIRTFLGNNVTIAKGAFQRFDSFDLEPALEALHA